MKRKGLDEDGSGKLQGWTDEVLYWGKRLLCSRVVFNGDIVVYHCCLHYCCIDGSPLLTSEQWVLVQVLLQGAFPMASTLTTSLQTSSIFSGGVSEPWHIVRELALQ